MCNLFLNVFDGILSGGVCCSVVMLSPFGVQSRRDFFLDFVFLNEAQNSGSNLGSSNDDEEEEI